MAFWKVLFNLRQGEENKDTVLKNVKASIPFTGSNLWILACAIVVASVGLNVNSTAVVIGAMLISPLMGPIVGAGFALGIYDFALLKKSLNNLLIATLVGLFVSFIYFFFTPFKDAQSEIISRTAPNIYDVLIAFFGGLVGVIAVTRVEKGNPIPGVAIATALMPPLCTAGYGLAIGNWIYFGGALFLYTINCTFICIATFIIIKFLDYPPVKQLNKSEEKRVHWIVYTLVLLIVLPSVFFAYRFLQEQQFKKQVKLFLSKEFEEKGNTIIYQKTNYNTTPKKLELAFLTRKFTSDEIIRINDDLKKYDIRNTHLIIRQDSSFLASKKIRDDVENEALKKNEIIVSELQKQLEHYRLKSGNLFPEAKAIFPRIQSLSIGKQEVFTPADTTFFLPVAFYQSNGQFPTTEQRKLRDWLKAKLSVDTIIVLNRE